MSFDVGLAAAEWASEKNIARFYAPSIGSTNTWAKENMAAGVYLTSHQTKGRGRGNHQWEDPVPGANLLSSWVFKTNCAPSPLTAPRAGLVVLRALLNAWPSLSISLKAPNDLYLNGRKLAGILIETVQQGSDFTLILGLGVNIFQAPDLAEDLQATHLPESFVSLETFHQFMSQMWSGCQDLVKIIESTSSQALTTQERNLILGYLNQNPSLKEAYTEVSASGDLHTSDSKTSWQDL